MVVDEEDGDHVLLLHRSGAVGAMHVNAHAGLKISEIQLGVNDATSVEARHHHRSGNGMHDCGTHRSEQHAGEAAAAVAAQHHQLR